MTTIGQRTRMKAEKPQAASWFRRGMAVDSLIVALHAKREGIEA
jgi:hypothetical protein